MVNSEYIAAAIKQMLVRGFRLLEPKSNLMIDQNRHDLIADIDGEQSRAWYQATEGYWYPGSLLVIYGLCTDTQEHRYDSHEEYNHLVKDFIDVMNAMEPML